MEQIVYCQEQVYRRALKEVKEKEAEEEENNFNFQCNSQAPQEDLSTTEMSQHPNAYYEVSGNGPEPDFQATSSPSVQFSV